MNLKSIKYCFIFIGMVFSWANFVNASVYINEVQLSPTEERFIELYNSGGSEVDLTDWYIQRKTATGSDFGSLVSKTYFEGKSIDAGGYFLISRNDMSGADIIYSGLTLSESNTIQIKNSNQELVDKIGWGDISDCGGTCAPNPISGKSIGKNQQGDWAVSIRTPRSSNGGSVNNENDFVVEENNNQQDNTNTVQTEDNNSDILKITTKIISPKTVIAKIPFSFDSLTTTNKGGIYAVGRFVWNFGDGMIKEVSKAVPFDYTYEYPGEYVVTLSYFDNSFTKIADSTNKITIKVVPAEVYISSVGSDEDPFIELENKSNYEITLSNWIVTGGIHYFVIPDGTTLLPNRKIKLSPKITGFVSEDIKSIKIVNSNKDIIDFYPKQTENKKPIQRNTSVSVVKNNDIILPSKNLQDDVLIKNPQIINLNDLGASVEKSEMNISNSTYALTGLFVIIGLGIISFLIIKRKNNTEDYIEKEISAKDMTIVE